MNNSPDDATRESTAASGAAGPSSVGFIGAGSVGTALALAIVAAGWPVTAFTTRDPERRKRFARLVPAAASCATPAEVAAHADLIFVTVPDDAIADVAAELKLDPGKTIVHTSGLLGADVLRGPLLRSSGSPGSVPPGSVPPHAIAPAVGAFHPLVSFTADEQRSASAIRGATVALEGDDAALDVLAALADALGAVPLRLPRGSKPVYHAAAVLASGGLVALLDAIATLGEAAGMDEAGAMAVFGRLIDQTLANARTVGLSAALTGPITRGDTGTLQSHLAAIEGAAPDVTEIYVAAARRELRIVEERGALAPDQVSRVGDVLAKVARPGTICT